MIYVSSPRSAISSYLVINSDLCTRIRAHVLNVKRAVPSRNDRRVVQHSYVYQYSKVRYGTTPGGRFLRSASHRAIQVEIFARLVALSTFTVATMRAQSSESAKHVSSKNELCSEYGTPKNCAFDVEPRAGRRCAYVNSRCGGFDRTEAMDGVALVPAGGE